MVVVLSTVRDTREGNNAHLNLKGRSKEEEKIKMILNEYNRKEKVLGENMITLTCRQRKTFAARSRGLGAALKSPN